MDKDSIGDRMKNNYENRYRIKLLRRTPVIIRLDGKAFHSLTRHCKKPFDEGLQSAMQDTALNMCSEIQGAKCAYVHSDEISILLTDFDKLTTDAWFDYNLQKMVSISASLASVYFTEKWKPFKHALFDSRAFNIPKEEVCNYFIWRQQDWLRNSLQMLSQSHFSHKELHKKNSSDMHEMLYSVGINWGDLKSIWKNGVFISRHLYDGDWGINTDIIFSNSRKLIEQYVNI